MDNLRRIICTKDEISGLPLIQITSGVLIKKLYIPISIGNWSYNTYGGLIFNICDVDGNNTLVTI